MNCPECYGKGIIRERKRIPLNPEYTLVGPVYQDWYFTCSNCNGTGVVHCCEGREHII